MLDILINPPKEVPLTTKEFHSLSIYEISCFFINWKICVEQLDNGNLKIWTSNYDLAIGFQNNYRFKNSIWYQNESLEIYHCTVKDENLRDTISKYFSHLFLK